MVKHNSQLDSEAKKYLPEGHSLDVDRRYNAKTVTKSLEEWKKNTSKMDLAGFDDRSAKEPSVKEVKKIITGGNSGDEVLMDEPERLLQSGQLTRNLIEKDKDKIYDFESFINVVKNSWRTDGSLGILLDNTRNNESFRNMFNQPLVQSWINENTNYVNMKYIMKKFRIEPNRASNILNKLPTSVKSKLFRVARRSKFPRIVIGRKRIVGKKPRWTKQEKNLVSNYRRLPLNKAYKIFDSTSPIKRSLNSFRNMYYKVKFKNSS